MQNRLTAAMQGRNREKLKDADKKRRWIFAYKRKPEHARLIEQRKKARKVRESRTRNFNEKLRVEGFTKMLASLGGSYDDRTQAVHDAKKLVKLHDVIRICRTRHVIDLTKSEFVQETREVVTVEQMLFERYWKYNIEECLGRAQYLANYHGNSELSRRIGELLKWEKLQREEKMRRFLSRERD